MCIRDSIDAAFFICKLSSYTKNNIPPDLIKAAELISQDKLKKAEPILRNYLYDDPLDVNAMKLLADIGVKFRAYKDAGYLLTRALDLAPDYVEARLSYANLLYKRQLPFEALKEIDLLLDKDKDIWLSISATTRSPRIGEKHGENYYFISDEKFKDMIDKKEFLEWAQFAGNYYGTPLSTVNEKIEKGFIVLLEIEVEGAKQIKEKF